MDVAKQALENLGYPFQLLKPIRGGTDGSKIYSWDYQLQTSLQVAKTCMDAMNMLLWNQWKKQHKVIIEIARLAAL